MIGLADRRKPGSFIDPAPPHYYVSVNNCEKYEPVSVIFHTSS